MRYAFTVDRKLEYLHVKVQGDNTPQNVLKYMVETREACVRYNCSSVLIEEDLEGLGLKAFEIFEVVSAGSKNVWPVVQRIAFVDVNPAHDFALMQFAETVAVNRGVNVRVFAKLRDAEEWLLAEIARDRPDTAHSAG